MVFSTLDIKKIFSILIQFLEVSLIVIGEAFVAVIIVTLEFFKVCWVDYADWTGMVSSNP